jgi:GNAT superfamily N-acetyltransferase
MLVIEESTAAEVRARAARRLADIDPLLPESDALPPGCGALFAAEGTEGSDHPAAIASCERWQGEPGSIDLAWGAARRFRLIPAIAGPDVSTALDSLIRQWGEHLAKAHDTGGDDTAAAISWPSRDVEGIRVLLRHGLAPRSVVAARTARLDRDQQVTSGPRSAGIVIRRAGPDDIDAVASMGIALVRYDDYFGSVIERPETEDALRKDSVDLLAAPEPWSWLAERDGVPVGMLEGLRPEAATWIAPMTRLAPVAYLQQGFVLPAERGSGIGAMLTATFHAELRRAGVAVALLHYSQVNPLSTPFWSQQEYRPLWTTWEARPARTLR